MWWTDISLRARGQNLKVPNLRAMGLVILATGALGACATDGPEGAGKPQASITPTEQYSIQVQESADRVAFNPHQEGLSMTQRTALAGLVNRWRASPDAGDLAVQTPVGADPAASRVSAEILSGLRAMGVPQSRIRTGDYDAAPTGPVLASYSHLEAKGPDCRGGWNNVGATGSNRPTEHFGCAVTANFAAQVADPRDFLEPSPVTASDATRREVILGKYRSGELSSTPRDPQAVGTISGAVGSK